MTVCKRSPSTKRKIQTFKQRIYEILVAYEALETEESNLYLLETNLGDLHIKINESWVRGVFADADRALEALGKSSQYHYPSGKWIWTGTDCVEMFKTALDRIMEEKLNVSMDQATFRARKSKFMSTYDQREGEGAGKQFLAVMQDLNDLSSSMKMKSPLARSFFESPPSGKVEILFRDIYPQLESLDFPAQGQAKYLEFIEKIKTNVWS